MDPIANKILEEALLTISNRAEERDQKEERSMKKCVDLVNAATGKDLTEKDGWVFMICLKLARSYSGEKENLDDYIDGASYFALAGESVAEK